MRVALLLLVILDFSSSHKILVNNPKYRHSHTNFLARIADILSEEGHEVTSLVSVLAPKLDDCTTKSTIIHVQPSEETAGHYAKMMAADSDVFNKPLFDFASHHEKGEEYGILWSTMCKKTLEEPGLIERLTNEKFDVVITENIDMCGMGLSHAIGARSVIMVSTTILFGQQYDEMGVPPSISFNPTLYMPTLNFHSITDRFWNIISDLLHRHQFAPCRTKVEEVFREKYGPSFPSLAELSSNVAYCFANSEPLIDFAHPTLHRVIDIGGLGAKTPKPLDQKWDAIMNLRDRSVLISFGSVVKSTKLSIQSKRAILQVARSFPAVTFIWKYEETEDDFCMKEASQVTNLVISSWMPQVDLLNHEKMALFVSHGGMGSAQETALSGVPALFIPLFGDQPRNAGMLQHNGLGRVFSKLDIPNAEKLTGAVRELLENKKYRENSRRMRKMLSKKPFKARELLVRHVEFAAEFGPSPSLRPSSHDMSFFELHNLDILLVSLLISVSICMILFIVVTRFCCGRSSDLTKSKHE